MDHNEPKGSKDCRLCDRRRVKCDRSLPTCKKCAKKGLECTGYGLVLQWGQGVASRGNLAGKTVPVLLRSNKLQKSTKEPHPVRRAQGVQNTSCISSLQSQPDSTRKEDALVIFQPSRCNLNREVVPRYALSSFPSPFLENETTRFFLHHYDQTVAANMAWADCEDNPWRTIMMPMAMKSPPLMFSILAFAAKHMSAMAASSSINEMAFKASHHSKSFGQRALELLAQELRPSDSSDDITRSVQRTGPETSNAILAAMLVLCNVETVWPDSSVWKVHLNAARTVLAARPEQETTSEMSVSSFLNQELFVASTFASITTFSSSVEIDPLAQEPGGVFVEFLKLLQQVTQLERQTFLNSSSLNTSNVSPMDFEILFEKARARTLQTSTKFKFSPRDGPLQFNRIVNSFYHAGLIYTYRALFSSTLQTETGVPVKLDLKVQIIDSKAALFEILEAMEMDTPTYAQDLVFPLFIAGTEATEIGQQEMVVSKLRQAMRGTGFSNCEQAVQFLTALWASRNNYLLQEAETSFAQSWIDFAREWSNQGHIFLVF